MRNGRSAKFYKTLFICAAVLILLVDLLFVIIPDKESSENENRNLQTFPSITGSALSSGRFEDEFDDYVADQFPLRDSWIAVKTFISRLAGYTESNDIFLGKDGYLIQNFNEPDEEEYSDILEEFTGLAAAYPDIDIYALIAPTAITVMEDMLPAFTAAADEGSRIAGDESAFMDRLFSDLTAAGIKAVDVRDSLKELKDSGVQVYYRTDHHWTSDAAYAAYNVWYDISGGTSESTGAALATANDIISDNGTLYYRLMVANDFQGTLTASSGFRMDETDEIYVYSMQGTLSEAADNLRSDDTEGSETDNDEFLYVLTNMDTGYKSASLYDTSYLETRDKYGMFLGGNHGELKIQTTAASSDVILLIKDSYANCFIPFMLRDHRTIIVIDPRYFTGDIDELIESEKVTEILYLYNAETLTQ